MILLPVVWPLAFAEEVVPAGEVAPVQESVSGPDTKTEVLGCKKAPRAWFGIDLVKADPSVRVQLPSLPEGIGFVVRSLDDGGPAATAGMKEYDVLWKFDDQLLVNESQLATLLRLHKPGDTVKLSAFRAGEHIEVDVKLGKAPKGRRPFPDDLVDAAVFSSGMGGPMRIVNFAEKTASYTTDEGTLKVWRDGKNYQVSIVDPEGKSLFEGTIEEHRFPKEVPDGWQRRVMALRRGLDHALEGRKDWERKPRPRVVPPAAENR
nr:PDZ domain-containing protein [Verrucomicrobiota bacterium JB025]